MDGGSRENRAVRRRQGVALVSILFIVALIAVLAHQLITEHQLTVAFTRQSLHSAQAREYARGGEEYARQILYEDWLDEETRAKDTLLEDWAQEFEEMPIDVGETGTLRLRIRDATSKLNVNGIVDPEHLARLKRLLAGLNLDEALAARWLDWIDQDLEPSEFGAEDSTYLLYDPAFRTPNRPVADISELLVLMELDADDRNRDVDDPEDPREQLEAGLIALPPSVKSVNINTVVSEDVMLSLGPGMGEINVTGLLELEREYESVEDVTADYAAFGDSAGAISVTTEYFIIEVTVELNGYRTDLTTLLHRDFDNGTMTTLSRNYGKLIAEDIEPEVL